jgi:hypothetical protein
VALPEECLLNESVRQARAAYLHEKENQNGDDLLIKTAKELPTDFLYYSGLEGLVMSQTMALV